MTRRILLLIAALAPVSAPAPAQPNAPTCGEQFAVPIGGASDCPCLCEIIIPLAAVEPASRFQTGCTAAYVLRSEEGANGNWGYLQLPRCDEGPCQGRSGSARLECEIESGYGCGTRIGQCLDTAPGARQGVLRDAIGRRFDADTDRRQGLCYEQYRGNGKRVVVVPITESLDNGRSQVCVRGFAAFFLREIGDDELEAEFVRYVAPGGATEP